LKVAVLDPKLILDFVDVVIGDYVYELQFGVEEETLTGESKLIDMDSTKEEEPREEDPKGGGPKEKRWMSMVKRLAMAMVIYHLWMASRVQPMGRHSWVR
jgi:hypothetical protein